MRKTLGYEFVRWAAVNSHPYRDPRKNLRVSEAAPDHTELRLYRGSQSCLKVVDTFHRAI